MFNICKTCSVQPTGSGYLVKKDNENGKFYRNLAEVKGHDLKDQKTSIVSITKYSDIDSLKDQIAKDKKFVDNNFPPSESSLGKIENVYTDKWKRITDLIQNPKMFGDHVSPYDVIHSKTKQTKNFQVALAIMAEKPTIIYNIFNNQTSSLNDKGLYCFLLKSKGKIHEIVIDDYVPINDQGGLMFSRSVNKIIWNILLEKARAKLYESYENMLKNSGSVRKIIEEFTYAPSKNIRHAEVLNKDQVWDAMLQCTKQGQIGYGLLANSDKLKWHQIGLARAEYYTIVDACVIENILGAKFKILKLRCPFSELQFNGEGSLNDTIFWEQLQTNADKKRMLTRISERQKFSYMFFSDYIKYFEETNFNYLEKNFSFFDEPLKFQNINGLLYELTILHEANYTLTVNQIELKSQNNNAEYVQDGWCRTSIMVAKIVGSKGSHQEFQLVDGLLKYNEKQPELRIKLLPAKYLLFLKIQPTIKHQNFPKNPVLSIFSTAIAQLTLTNQQSYPEFLKRMFLVHARSNKKQTYNADLMWSAWKLILQGGYAYIAFGNSASSKRKFVIKFSEELFLQYNFSLKKPYKYKGNQHVQILPGQQQIILLRVKNSLIKQITFPPPIDLQIIDIV